jgi:integrase
MSVSSEAVAGRLRVKTDAIDLEAICRRRHKHDLRHTAACLWLAKGVDPVTVQAWLGHASIATTNIYLLAVCGGSRLGRRRHE